MAVNVTRPIRVGVFDTVDEVQGVVADLRAAGFMPEQISVLCSDHVKSDHFPEYVHVEPGLPHASRALTRAGVASLGLGGATVLVGVLTSASTAVFAVGAFAGIALVGTFAAVMMSRGAEGDLSDYYDQAMVHGKLLVAIDAPDDAWQRLADDILDRHGAQEHVALSREV